MSHRQKKRKFTVRVRNGLTKRHNIDTTTKDYVYLSSVAALRCKIGNGLAQLTSPVNLRSASKVTRQSPFPFGSTSSKVSVLAYICTASAYILRDLALIYALRMCPSARQGIIYNSGFESWTVLTCIAAIPARILYITIDVLGSKVHWHFFAFFSKPMRESHEICQLPVLWVL